MQQAIHGCDGCMRGSEDESLHWIESELLPKRMKTTMLLPNPAVEATGRSTFSWLGRFKTLHTILATTTKNYAFSAAPEGFFDATYLRPLLSPTLNLFLAGISQSRGFRVTQPWQPRSGSELKRGKGQGLSISIISAKTLKVHCIRKLMAYLGV